MTSNPILFHCSCLNRFSLTKAPPNSLPLSSFHHKELSNLLFCEECDSIRCDQCILLEITCYFCPNCLFEVPSASVKSEKNRCARNCFQCPQCTHTLSVVASDPDPSIPKNQPGSSSGVPPYYLSCQFCRWDSKEVDITFEKPTGLAHQSQKGEDNSPEILEFDHLKEHLEPYLRRGQSQTPHASTSQNPTTTSTVLSSSSLLASSKDSSRYSGSLFGLNSRSRGIGSTVVEGKGARDELEEYKSLNGSAQLGGKGKMVDRDSEMVRQMREMIDIETVASLDKRWTEGFNPSILASKLKPLRTPLQSKLSKRCSVCKHILIKPEQKSSSTRFKIKLVASNYLPSITMYRRPPASSSLSRLSNIGTSSTTGGGSSSGSTSGRRGVPPPSISSRLGSTEDEPLRPGRTYTFELSFVNPLYEPIHVRLAVARPTSTPPPIPSSSTTQSPDIEMAPPGLPPYAVNLPTSSFSIKAHAEEWEYEDEENNHGTGDEMNVDEDVGGEGNASPSKKRRAGGSNAGIVERKMNRTTIIMEVAVGKETVGVIRANMLVTYIYQSDEVAPVSTSSTSTTKSPTKKSEKEDMKKFSFWTLITLGTVKESSRRAAQASITSIST